MSTECVEKKNTLPNGDQEWRVNGFYHRIDGPALITSNGWQIWCHHGLRHRIDGPAVTYYNGNVEWWIAGKTYAFADWLKATTLDDDQKLLLKLQYG